MEIQIKRAVKAGNSSAVILPRSWLNKEVRIELVKKTPETILTDVMEIVKKYITPEEIIGVYLTGSYARGEEDKNSDIDILIITKNTDKEMVHEGIYNILIISQELLDQKLNLDLFPIGQMIREAKPLLNSSHLNSIKVKITKKNVKWYLDTTKDKLKIIKEVVEKTKNRENVSDLVAYTLILRIRTLHIIEKIIKREDYSKEEFVHLIHKISNGKNAYEGYLSIKNNQENKSQTTIEEVKNLYEYLKNQLKRIKKLVNKL